jgi:hypothetical protein
MLFPCVYVYVCMYVCIMYVARWLSAFFRCDYDEAIQEYPAWGVRIPPRLLERCVRGSQRPHLFTYPGYTTLSHTYIHVYLQQLARIPYIYSTYVRMYVCILSRDEDICEKRVVVAGFSPWRESKHFSDESDYILRIHAVHYIHTYIHAYIHAYIHTKICYLIAAIQPVQPLSNQYP